MEADGGPRTTVADRAVERALEPAMARARDDVAQLVTAGLAVLRRKGAAELTVAEVLAEARLSTRAFYRHFGSKDELLLAVYEHEVALYQPRLRRRLAAAGSPRAALEAWIDELLATGFEPRRGARTRAMFELAPPLHQEFPVECSAVRDALTDPLVEVLRAGLDDGTFPCTEPTRDARFVRALTWELVEERLSGAETDRADALGAVLRFCLPALGAEA